MYRVIYYLHCSKNIFRLILLNNKHSVAMKRLLTPLLLLLLSLTGPETAAQKRNAKKSLPDPVPQEIFTGLSYRNIGPFRGGRVAAVEGIEGNGELFYMGATGGGVWKTKNRGETWINISDGFFGGTIGAVDVSDSDNNILFAAGGEKTVRGNVSHGYGIWKSVDAGETWEYSGLAEGQYIPQCWVSFLVPAVKEASIAPPMEAKTGKRYFMWMITAAESILFWIRPIPVSSMLQPGR